MDDQRTGRMGFGVDEDPRGCLRAATIICASTFLISAAVLFAGHIMFSHHDTPGGFSESLYITFFLILCFYIAMISACALLICSVGWAIVWLSSKRRK